VIIFIAGHKQVHQQLLGVSGRHDRIKDGFVIAISAAGMVLISAGSLTEMCLGPRRMRGPYLRWSSISVFWSISILVIDEVSNLSAANYLSRYPIASRGP
jgi:hypothetical protein